MSAPNMTPEDGVKFQEFLKFMREHPQVSEGLNRQIPIEKYILFGCFTLLVSALAALSGYRLLTRALQDLGLYHNVRPGGSSLLHPFIILLKPHFERWNTSGFRLGGKHFRCST